MSMTTEEAYKLLRDIKNKENTIEFFFIDALCYCLFDDYKEGAEGYEQRQLLRRHRPAIYEEIEACNSHEEFAGIIAQYKLEGV